METPPPSRDAAEFLDIQEVAREIRRRVQGRLPEATPQGEGEAPRDLPETGLYQRGPVALNATGDLCRAIESGQLLAGDPPPQPPTVRGKFGSVLVQVVRRMLFWYTRPLREFQQMTARALRQQADGIRKIDTDLRRLEQANNEIAALQARIRELEAALRRTP